MSTMRAYIALGTLFIILLIVISVIVIRDGVYREEISELVSSTNLELVSEVSLGEEEHNPITQKDKQQGIQTALLIEAAKGVESENDDTFSEAFPEEELSVPDLGEFKNDDSQPDSGEKSEEIRDEPVPGSELYVQPESKPPPPVFPVDINTAQFKELQNITGVGPAIAKRIIDDRARRGPFYYIHDIRRVNGVGDATFEKMRYQITVGNITLPPPPPSPPPTPAENPSPVPTEAPSPVPSKISINAAGLEELQKITGVGPVISERIIEYRTTHGPFQIIDDIKNVKGIGDTTFLKMQNEIAI